MVETSLRPQKMYCTHRLFHMTVFLPQSIHLTYEEFLLVSLSFSRNLMHSSSTLAVNDQKWGTWPPARREGSVTTNCSQRSSFWRGGSHVFWIKLKSRLTLNQPYTYTFLNINFHQVNCSECSEIEDLSALQSSCSLYLCFVHEVHKLMHNGNVI